MKKSLVYTLAILALTLGLLPTAATAAQFATAAGSSGPAAMWPGLGGSVASTTSPTLASARARHLLDTAGLLLIPDSTNDRVMAFDPLTGDLVDPDFIPADPTNLSTPIHAILSASGNSILVSDQVKDVVQEYDLNGNFLSTFAPAGGPNPGILDNIRGIALRPNGNLLVTVGGGANEDAVAEFDSGGNYLGNFVTNGAGGLGSPFDVYGRAGDWLVGGIDSDAIHRYDLSGSYLDNLAAINSFPEQIAEAANDNVLVANFSGTQEGVVEYLPDGTLVGIYDPPSLGGYRGVCELPNGNILITNGSGVHEIDRAGNLVETKIADVSGRFIELIQTSVGSDLVLTKTVTPDLAAPGDTITYTLSFRQAGTYTTTGAIITDMVPISLTNLHYWHSGALVTPTGVFSYTWLVEDLSPDEGGTITITGEVVTGLAAGTLFTNTGSITGPEPDDNPANNSSTAPVTVLNVPPVAVDDQASTLQNDPVTIAVLDNDSDPNNDPLEVISVGLPANGSSSTDGTWVIYTPTLDFVGTDLFSYTISDGALMDQAWITVTVIPCDDPTAVNFSWMPPVPLVGEVVTFTGSASGTLPLTFTWALGDGGTASGQQITHSYASADSYAVTLTVINHCGMAFVTHTVVVTMIEPCEPVQILTVTTAISGCEVTFGTAFTGTAPYTWEWDFGALGTSTETNPVVDFGVSGTYPYTLTAENACGDDTWASEVTVECTPPCEPVQILTVTTAISGCEVTFGTAFTGTAPYRWAWDFGALGTSTETNPLVDFGTSGTYPYTLTAANDCGSDLWADEVTVECAPPAGWKIYLPLLTK